MRSIVTKKAAALRNTIGDMGKVVESTSPDRAPSVGASEGVAMPAASQNSCSPMSESERVAVLKVNCLDALVATLPTLRAAYLFGSSLNTHFHAGSDIDLAVDIGRRLEPVERFDAAQSLAQCLKREVDLIDFRVANAVFRHRILTTGVRLFAIDPVAQNIYEAAVLTEYLDFAAQRQPYLDDITKRARVYV